MAIIKVERLIKPFYNNLQTKRLWFMIILFFGVGLLFYQLYISSHHSSIIEGLETDQSQTPSPDSSSNPPIPTTNDIFVIKPPFTAINNPSFSTPLSVFLSL